MLAERREPDAEVRDVGDLAAQDLAPVVIVELQCVVGFEQVDAGDEIADRSASADASAVDRRCRCRLALGCLSGHRVLTFRAAK